MRDFLSTEMVLTFSLFEGKLVGFRRGDVLERGKLVGLLARRWFLVRVQLMQLCVVKGIHLLASYGHGLHQNRCLLILVRSQSLATVHGFERRKLPLLRL